MGRVGHMPGPSFFVCIGVSMLRRYSGLLCLCFAAAIGVFMCGCESEASKVTRALEPHLEAYVARAEDKTGSSEMPAPDYGDAETEGILLAYGVDVDELHKLCFARYGYNIGDVRVKDDGKTADVSISVSNVSLAHAADAAASDYKAFASNEEAQSAYAKNGRVALLDKLFDYLFQHLRDDELVTSNAVVTLTKGDDGAWVFDPAGNTAYFNALYGGSNVIGGLADCLGE